MKTDKTEVSLEESLNIIREDIKSCAGDSDLDMLANRIVKRAEALLDKQVKEFEAKQVTTLTPCIKCERGYKSKHMVLLFGEWICPNCVGGMVDQIVADALDKQRVEIEKSKNNAYWERNQLVLALSKIYPAWLERHPEEDKEWEDDWRWIVFIEVPYKDIEQKYIQGGFEVTKKGQLSWHIHDSEKNCFDHLQIKNSHSWDGHSTEEKYRRLRLIKSKYSKSN